MRRPQLHDLALALGLALASATAHAIRPTPHQLIDQALRPLHDQLAQMNPTDAERASVADVLARGEALAAEAIEAQHAGDTARLGSVNHRIELLARWMRGRIEAVRAEAAAGETERAALEADAERVQARAALERAAERALEVDRAPPDAPPSVSATPLPATLTRPAAPAAAHHGATAPHAAGTR